MAIMGKSNRNLLALTAWTALLAKVQQKVLPGQHLQTLILGPLQGSTWDPLFSVRLPVTHFEPMFGSLSLLEEEN